MKLKIGVMGAYRGKNMIDVLMAYNEDAEVVAICDKFESALINVRRQAEDMGITNIAFYNNFEDFIKHDMDAVCLANYATEHAPFAIKCLKAGKHVLSECLPCETMAQAVELIEAVEESGKVYAYAENFCYMRSTYEMWKKYEQGQIGEVTYAEGEYVHDLASCWPQITYGDKTHWRNRMYPTFYCTHSIGPLLTITGKRPVSVVGFECRPSRVNFEKGGLVGGAGIEMITLDNGAVVKSIHGSLKREGQGENFNYQVYCEKGMMESGRFLSLPEFNYYQESEKLCEGTWNQYTPQNEYLPEMAEKFPGHNGGDFYPTYFFIQKILGKEAGKYSIDVYTAVEMGICGILAWRSVLNGNIPVKVPNLRNKEERDAYRNDNACTNPSVARDKLLPMTTFEGFEPDDAVFDKVKKLWEEGKNINGDPDLIYSAILDVTEEKNKS